MKYTRKNPLKVMTTFSGYDSQCLALERLKKRDPEFDYELVGWSEIEPNAIKAHNLIFPQWEDRNYGDITKIDWEKVPDFDLFTYSSPCFVAGTNILTEDGYKPIEELKVGDRVYTMDHTIQPITAVGSDPDKDIFEVTAMGCLPIRCTANHPFLIREKIKEWNERSRSWVHRMGEPVKRRVEDFNGKEYIGIPVIQDTVDTEYNDETLWLVGRYLADGHINERQMVLSVGNAKIHEFDHIQQSHSRYPHTESCYRVCFGKHSDAYKAVVEFTNCGKALTKDVTLALLSLPTERLRHVLDGYMSGDGCYISKSGCWQATTVSKALAEKIVLMVQKTLHTGVKVYYNERPKTHVIEGRTVNQHDTYMIRYIVEGRTRGWKYEDGYFWYPVRKVTDLGIKERVYNITVDNNHTYMAENVMVFNCQDFSNAGLQRGGEEGSGTRSSLLWECRKAIEAKRPSYCMLENVKALVSKKFKPLFLKWVETLESLGYTSYWQVLNSKDYGVPQNRERVFLISIRNDVEENFRFPSPFPLERHLKDVLEPKVDEKYYLSDKALEYFRRVNDDPTHNHSFIPREGSSDAASVTTNTTRVDGNFVKDGE